MTRIEQELARYSDDQDDTTDGTKNIVIPDYEKDEDLGIYIEMKPPSKQLYKAVGYNDLTTISKMMVGTDEEKRNEEF